MHRPRHLARPSSSPLTVALTALSVLSLILALTNLIWGERIDAYYMISSGSWMIDHHAIERFNVDAPIPLPIENQNWLWCVIYAALFRIGEHVGQPWLPIIIFQACIVYILWKVIYKAAYALTKNTITARVSQMALMLTNGFVSDLRSTTFSLIVIIVVFWFATEVSRKVRPTWHMALPLTLIVIHLNTQAALVILDVALLFFCFFTSTLRNKKLDGALLVSALITVAIMLTLNPYPNIVIHQLTNSSDALSRIYVNELNPINPVSAYQMLPLLSIITIGYYYGEVPRFRKMWPEVLLTTLFMAASIATVRLLVYATTFSLFIMWNADEQPFDAFSENATITPSIIKVLTVFVAIIIAQLIATCTSTVINANKTLHNNQIQNIFQHDMNWMGEDIFEALNQIPDDDSPVFSYDANYSSFLAITDHTVAMTSRWEVWDQPTPTSDSWFNDYFHTINDDKWLQGAMENVDWKWIILTKHNECDDVKAYLDASPSYKQVYKSENAIIYESIDAVPDQP